MNPPPPTRRRFLATTLGTATAGLYAPYLFAADAGERVVLQYNDAGEIVGQIGRSDPDRQMPGFIIPSPYFDVVVGPDEAIHIVNPGARRIQLYRADGNLEGYWGEAGSSIREFFGCCNPAHLAVLSDGRFVTAEKGAARVKVYRSTGEFECVVAGPEQLAVRGDDVLADVAVDGRDRILVLDPAARVIRVFQPKPREP